MSSPLRDSGRKLVIDGGWHFLLPPAPFQRLLCYDNLGGASTLLAAHLAEEVLVVHHDPEELERLRVVAATEELGGVRFANSEAVLDPGGPGGFDGALVHDPEARILRRDRGSGPPVDMLCARLAATLRPQGFLYLGLSNRFSYRRARAFITEPQRPLSVRATTNAMERAGFLLHPVNPFLMEGTAVTEIIPPAGYRSGKNRFLLTERMRELVLQRWGRRHLAPAYGVVGFRGTPEPTWLDRIVADPWVRSLAPESSLRRCLVLNNGKLVLSLGPERARHGAVVLIVIPDYLPSYRRRTESQWLGRLAGLPPEIARVVPVSHGEREIEGVRVFALSERPGITVDHDASFLHQLTATAAEWLRNFHRATAQPVEIDTELFSRAFAPLFDRARGRNRALSAEITALEEQVRSDVSGRVLSLGWMHGDYKLENVVFDERSWTLQGVIDWDLAWEPGAPVIDLLYLLCYNRVVREGTGVIAVSEATLLRQEWTPDERALLDAHHAAVGSSRALEPALGALFVVHHIGVRHAYNVEREEVLVELRDLLLGLRGRLATKVT